MMVVSDSEKWDRIYDQGQHGHFPPAIVLHRNQHLLPKQGIALDLACGLGRNAIYLSRLGLETHAWDISNVAIAKLNEYANREGLTIHTQVRDNKLNPPEQESFDVIVVAHFLERSIIPDLIRALKPGGLIFYQTFTKLKTSDVGPKNPEYLLDRNELLHLFKELTIVTYCEEADIGDQDLGLRNEAMIIAQKI